jgi:two-component system LytT family response regulator
VKDELSLQNSFVNIKALLDNLAGVNSLTENLVIPDSKGFTVVKTSDIIMCEADGYCTRFYLTENVKISSSRNLKYYEELLPKNIFLRTHHSCLLNLQHVKGYSHQEEILMIDNIKCPLSSGNKHTFISHFKKHK